MTQCKELNEQYLKHMVGEPEEADKEVEPIASGESAAVVLAIPDVRTSALQDVNYKMALRDQLKEGSVRKEHGIHFG